MNHLLRSSIRICSTVKWQKMEQWLNVKIFVNIGKNGHRIETQLKMASVELAAKRSLTFRAIHGFEFCA